MCVHWPAIEKDPRGDQAQAMVLAGVDILVAHLGLTTAGSIGATIALSLGQAVERVISIAGFFGASSIERLPTERAIQGQVEAFKGLRR